MANRAAEASSSGQRCPEVLPKFPIFLSHSGHDKPFVERLCEKLEDLNYSPFFDQNSDCLPKAERFPPHIFKAAQECLLAVIVLSEGYLTSKWPMLELAAFVKAKETKNPNMKLLPLFYKLRPSDLVPEKWMESWKKLVADGKIDAQEIDLWRKAVEVLMKDKNDETERRKSLTDHDEQDEIMLAKVVKDLRPFNGLDIRNYGTSEGRYIKAVVDVIYEIIPPMKKYNTDRIRGCQRLCEKASSLFEEGSLMRDVCKPGCFYLGFYGMGGVGKTTLCEAMCSFYEEKFRGRVCHVELQGDAGDRPLKRLKHVIKELGGCDDRVLQRITMEFEGLKCLQDRLKSQPPAFLAVDNVGDSESSRDEARSFISCGLACGSKIMVTSRSRLILESVLREAKYCKPIPRLEEQEAEELFLSVAIPQKLSSPLLPSEDVIVKVCVQECKFLDDGYDTQQYHPLVLRALGTFFHDFDKDDIMKWKEALMFEKKLQESRESKHVNDILGLNYETLSDGQKLLFLDVVFLFNNVKSLSILRLLHRTRDSLNDMYKSAISLIAAMHGISTFQATVRVKELQRKSLIYESSPTLRVHDLYIEFARSVISMEGSKEKERWVGHRDANGYNPTLKRLLVSEHHYSICHPQQLWKCPNLECLIMSGCKGTLMPKLDFEYFPNLRVLIVGAIRDDYDPFKNNVELLCTSVNALNCDLSFCQQKAKNKGCLPELRTVVLGEFDLRWIRFLRQCWNLTFLSIGSFNFDILEDTQHVTSLFEKLMALETLIFSSYSFFGFRNSVVDGILKGATKLKNLKFLEIELGSFREDLDGSCKLDLSPLGSLTSLETLCLPRLPRCIKELRGLNQLSQLSELNLEDALGLEKLPNLDLLPNLSRICINSCSSLNLEDQLQPCLKELHPGELHHQCLKWLPNFANLFLNLTLNRAIYGMPKGP